MRGGLVYLNCPLFLSKGLFYTLESLQSDPNNFETEFLKAMLILGQTDWIAICNESDTTDSGLVLIPGQ